MDDSISQRKPSLLIVYIIITTRFVKRLCRQSGPPKLKLTGSQRTKQTSPACQFKEF